MSIRNAIVESTHLGKEDHGIVTCQLHLSYGSSNQSFGGHSLMYEKYGIAYINAILETLNVNKWENLPGTHLRVKSTSQKIVAIGHIINDTWFNPEEDLT
jgi:hypothetical protein